MLLFVMDYYTIGFENGFFVSVLLFTGF